MVQQRPGHRRAPSTQIPDAPVVRHFRSRVGAKGGVIISYAAVTSLSKFRASRVLTYLSRVAVITASKGFKGSQIRHTRYRWRYHDM